MAITTENILKTIADCKKLGEDAADLASSNPLMYLVKLGTVIADIQTVLSDLKGLASDPEVAQIKAAAMDAVASATASLHKIE